MLRLSISVNLLAKEVGALHRPHRPTVLALQDPYIANEWFKSDVMELESDTIADCWTHDHDLQGS